MPNDSSTGGYLSGTLALGLQDDALDSLMQQMVSGITGIAGTFVRPRWQSTVPKQPEPGIDWCAIGVTEFDPDDYPVEIHANDCDTQTTFETLTLMASFYGPHAGANASAMRRGLYVAQNREQLNAAGMDVIDAMKPTAAPAFINQQWVRKFDVTIRIRRELQATYPILDLLSAVTSITPN